MLVMELAKLGPLNKYLRSHSNSVTIATISLFMSQVCEVCVYVCVCVCVCVCFALSAYVFNLCMHVYTSVHVCLYAGINFTFI